MKSQSESLAKEYDRLDLDFTYNMKYLDILTIRLMEEKDRLQRKVNIMGEDKKDD